MNAYIYISCIQLLNFFSALSSDSKTKPLEDTATVKLLKTVA